MFKKFFLMLTITGALLSGASVKNFSENPEARTCPDAGIVSDLDFKNDLVTISFSSGMLFDFYGIDDLMVGDIVAVTMDDNGTPDYVMDDKTINIKYAGSTTFSDLEYLEAVEHMYE